MSWGLGNSRLRVQLKSKARCLAARAPGSDEDLHRFLVGTTALGEENRVHALEYDESSEQLTLSGSYDHPEGEIWDVSPSPADASLTFTVYNTGTSTRAALWRIPSKSSSSGSGSDGSLEKICDVPALSGGSGSFAHRQVLWDPSLRGGGLPGYDDLDGDLDDNLGAESSSSSSSSSSLAAAASSAAAEPTSQRVVVVDKDALMLFDLSADRGSLQEVGAARRQSVKAATATATAIASASATPTGFYAAAWDPHHQSEVAACVGCGAQVWDLRSLKRAHSLSRAHAGPCRDCDYNPNKP